jgi:hypothetical protein
MHKKKTRKEWKFNIVWIKQTNILIPCLDSLSDVYHMATFTSFLREYEKNLMNSCFEH